jgi:hypothetical protein
MPTNSTAAPRRRAKGVTDRSEKDANLAQKLGQL